MPSIEVSKPDRRATPIKVTPTPQTSSFSSPAASSSSSSSSLRIRDNQRRSRARRKEYIQELEQRLRSLEAKGVQATREVQSAGRRVAAENTVLRSLLRLRGISDQEVGAYLARHRTDFNGALPIVPPGDVPIPKERSYVEESLGLTATTDIEDFSQPISTDHERRGERKLETNAHEPSYPPVYQQVAATEQPVPVRSLTHDISNLHPSLCDHESSGQATPCDAAARIITSMRSDSDARDVRSELGCKPGAECMVRNMDIFQLLDG